MAGARLALDWARIVRSAGETSRADALRASAQAIYTEAGALDVLAALEAGG
jgi:hypothetical protein